MSEVKLKLRDTKLEWHSIEETPPLHPVHYAGEIWLQSAPLLLVNGAGKIAVGYCQQAGDGRPSFETGAGNESLDNISLWARVELPGRGPGRIEQDFVPKRGSSG